MKLCYSNGGERPKQWALRRSLIRTGSLERREKPAMVKSRVKKSANNRRSVTVLAPFVSSLSCLPASWDRVRRPSEEVERFSSIIRDATHSTAPPSLPKRSFFVFTKKMSALLAGDALFCFFSSFASFRAVNASQRMSGCSFSFSFQTVPFYVPCDRRRIAFQGERTRAESLERP